MFRHFLAVVASRFNLPAAAVLVIAGTAFAAPQPTLTISAATGSLPGRSDYLAPGGSLTLQANVPAGTPVTWFRNGEPIAAAPASPELTLSPVMVSSTGNYHAAWRTDGRLVETALLPINAGPLPASHFNDATAAVEGTSGKSQTTIRQLLSDGRIVIDQLAYGGVGYSIRTSIFSADLSTSTSLHYYVVDLPSLLGVLDDGSFYVSSAPYRYRAPDAPLPFTMPAVFTGAFSDPAREVVDHGSQGILIFNSTHLVAATREGQVRFTRTATDLGVGAFQRVQSLPDGRIAVHATPRNTPASAGAGELFLLTATGQRDPTFSAFGYQGELATRLADGSWSVLTPDEQRRFDAHGRPLSTRPLPFTNAPGRRYVAPSGNIYGLFEGLGVVRYRAADLSLDPGFFLPQFLAAPTDLALPVERPDGRLVAIARGANLIRPLEAAESLDHSAAIPVIGHELAAYGTRNSDSRTGYHAYVPGPDNEFAPVAGQPFTVFCPYFGDSPLTARWVPLDGTTAPAATTDGTLHIPSHSLAYAGRYQLVVSNANGTSVGPIVDLRTTARPRLINLSGRSRVGADASVAIAGFVLRARAEPIAATSNTLPLVLRGIGPTLAQFDVAAPLADPTLELRNAAQESLATNDDWLTESRLSHAVLNRVGAFIPDAYSKDATLYRTLPAGAYTAATSPKPGQSGIALTEIYTDDTALQSGVELVNLSLRGHAAAAENSLVAGFVIQDPDRLGRPLRVLIRGVGPTLAGFDVAAPAANPILRLYNNAGEQLALNDDWGISPDAIEIRQTAEAVGAFALPAGSADAAMLRTLPPGAYTAHVEASGGAAGTALLEIYIVRDGTSP